MNDQLYFYKAHITGVIDGDTLDSVIDLGFRESRTERLRLANINAPERRTGKPGADATAHTKARVEGKDVLIRTAKDDDFGRWIALVYVDGICLNDELVEMGLAVPYMETKSGL